MIVHANTADLMSEAMVVRYANAHAKSLAGMRLILDALGIDLPANLVRKRPGPMRGEQPARVTVWRDRRRTLA
jgi:hypothetical protein